MNPAAGLLRTLVSGLVLALAVGACGPQYVETEARMADFPGDSAEESPSLERLRNAVTTTYRVYVANESSDDVSRVAFTPGRGITVEKTIPVGLMPGDIDGAHGVTVSPDGSRWYVSVAHGTPNGWLWQFETGTDELIQRTELGRFPSTMGITPDGSMIFVANFNLHGDPVPSDISVIYTPTMTPLNRIRACVRPHGARVSVDGTTVYSGCTGSEQVVAVDTRSLEVVQRFSVDPGAEGHLPLDDDGDRDDDIITDIEVRPELQQSGGNGGGAADGGDGDGGDAGGGDIVTDIEVRPELQDRTCSPSWVEPAEGRRAGDVIYVTCNRNAEVLIVDVSGDEWEITDRFSSGPSPYNLEITPDGRFLLVTLRTQEGGVAVFDMDSGGVEVARLETTERLTHGVVSSPDGLYAFVTNESVGSDPGTVDVFDLRTFERVASAELGHQSGGIDFWEARRFQP